MPVFAVRRSELKDGDCLCNHCTALCCRYFSLPFDPPVTWDDYERLSRYLTFGRIAVFAEDEIWYLVVQGDCQYLTPDYRCGIYTERPLICGQYTTDGCEYDNDVMFEKYFETPEQIIEYAEALLPPRPRAPSKRQPPRKVEQVLPDETAAGRDHFCMKIDTPTDWDDYDNFRWYMTHGPVALLVADDTWYLVVFGNEKGVHAISSNTVHSGRASKPGQHVPLERYFETPDQIWEYAAAVLPDREPLDRDKPQKITLPVLNG